MSERYALCVGINDYPSTYNDLYGCVNDAMDWADLLRDQGYTVYSLTDGNATKKAITDSLKNLVAKAGWGDKVVFTFSGHGTWLQDTDGDESDGRDEALCCVDFERGGLLTDDELQRIFGESKTGTSCLVLSDSCHSGTVSRFTAYSRPGTRFISPAAITPITPERAYAIERTSYPAMPPRRTASLISGCGDLEYSYDASFGGRANGAFTRAAIDTYQHGITLNNWYKQIRKQLPSAYYPQSPQLSATAYRKYTRAL